MLDVNTADADDCDAAIETDPLHDDAKLYFSKHKGLCHIFFNSFIGYFKGAI